MRRILAVAGTALVSAIIFAPAAQAKTGDSIISFSSPGVPGPVQFSDTVSETINAVRSNKKATATGTISGHFNIGTFDATVNFISVSGTEACAAATVTDSTISGVDPGAGVIFSVKDGGSPGALDLARTSFLPDNPGGCSFDITSPSGVTSGDIQVTDNHNP